MGQCPGWRPTIGLFGYICVMNDIVSEIIMIRKYKKLSQRELASLVGCSRNHIQNIESRKTKPSLKMLRRIGDALGKDLVIAFVVK